MREWATQAGYRTPDDPDYRKRRGDATRCARDHDMTDAANVHLYLRPDASVRKTCRACKREEYREQIAARDAKP